MIYFIKGIGRYGYNPSEVLYRRDTIIDFCWIKGVWDECGESYKDILLTKEEVAKIDISTITNSKGEVIEDFHYDYIVSHIKKVRREYHLDLLV